jgi:HAD superfamily hydrolase (TIGR01549 family)
MSIDLTRIRGLCFDVDGTLSDTDDAMVARFTRGLLPFRRLLGSRAVEDLARRIVMGIETPGNFIMGIPDRFGLDEPLYRLSEAINRLQARRVAKAFWIVPGVREALESLRPHFPMSVVSARDERSCLDFLNQYDLLGLFDAVATAHTCEHTKPYPDPIHWAAEKMGLSAADCLMIGDTVVDIRSGKAAGAQTVGVLCGFGEEKELARAGADLIVRSTTHIPGLLLEARQAPGDAQKLPVINPDAE